MNELTEKEEKIDKTVVCRICKSLLKDPFQLPCFENICNSHLNDYTKEEETNLVERSEFNTNDFICSVHKNDGYSELFSECKRLLIKLIDFDQTFVTKQENDLNEYFSNLRSKVDLRREEVILVIHKVSDDLLDEINEIEKDYQNKLTTVFSDFDFEEFKAKLKNYENDLNKHKIEFNEWTQIKEKIKKDLAELDKIREDTNRLVLSKDKIKFKYVLADEYFKNLFGQITKGLLKNRLISGSQDKSIKVWDLGIEECIKTINEHKNSVTCLELLDDEKLASGSGDSTIKIWDLKSFKCLKTLNGHSSFVYCLKKANENEIISGSADSEIKIWDLNSASCLKTLKGHTLQLVGLEITKDKNIIISCSRESIKIWNYQNGECLRTITGNSNGFTCVNLINNQIISGSYKEIKIWNFDSGECLKTLIDHDDWINCVKSYKENQFISCSWDGEIKLWDIKRGICFKTIQSHNKCIWALEVSEDGKIFSGSVDKSIKIWNIENGKCLKTLTGHSQSVYGLVLI